MWKESLLSVDDIISVTKLLEKYQDLVLYCPNNKNSYNILYGLENLNKPVKKNRWAVVDIPKDWNDKDKYDLQPFTIRDTIIGEMLKVKEIQNSLKNLILLRS